MILSANMFKDDDDILTDSMFKIINLVLISWFLVRCPSWDEDNKLDMSTEEQKKRMEKSPNDSINLSRFGRASAAVEFYVHKKGYGRFFEKDSDFKRLTSERVNTMRKKNVEEETTKTVSTFRQRLSKHFSSISIETGVGMKIFQYFCIASYFYLYENIVELSK